MTDAEVLTRLTALFRHLFEDPAIELRHDTSAGDIPGWDSMAQVTLAVEIEQSFKVRIRSAEMEELRNIGDLIELIRSRTPLVA